MKASVHLDGIKYLCSKCHTMTENLINRYCVNMDILDSTMLTTITAFDKEAGGLSSQAAEDMLKIYKKDSEAENIGNNFQKPAGTEEDEHINDVVTERAHRIPTMKGQRKGVVIQEVDESLRNQASTVTQNREKRQ